MVKQTYKYELFGRTIFLKKLQFKNTEKFVFSNRRQGNAFLKIHDCKD